MIKIKSIRKINDDLEVAAVTKTYRKVGGEYYELENNTMVRKVGTIMKTRLDKGVDRYEKESTLNN